MPRVIFNDTGQEIDAQTGESESGEKAFTCEPWDIDAGYQKCIPHYGTRFCQEESRERIAVVAPMEDVTVEGGFVPLNNVFSRI